MDFPDTSRVDEFRRRQMWAMTPEERVERANELNQQAMETLKANPTAYQAYLKRNFRERRQSTPHQRDDQ